jgi:hypothetical protein
MQGRKQRGFNTLHNGMDQKLNIIELLIEAPASMLIKQQEMLIKREVGVSRAKRTRN